MPIITVDLNGDGAFKDLEDRNWIEIPETSTIRIAVLEGGMTSGKPSVGIAMLTAEGTVVFAQTSLALWRTVNHLIEAKYGDKQ